MSVSIELITVIVMSHIFQSLCMPSNFLLNSRHYYVLTCLDFFSKEYLDFVGSYSEVTCVTTWSV